MMQSKYLARFSRLSISSLSPTAGKHVPSVYLATQDSHADAKLTAQNPLTSQHLIRHDKIIKSSGQVPVQQIRQFFEAKTISDVIYESFLTKNERLQFSERSQGVDMYKCPSRHTDQFTNMVILDNVPSTTTFYDCPVSSVIDNIKAPSIDKSQVLEKPGTAAPKMEAKIIMRIRHKKMKKHKLKKLRKRMFFLWRRHRLARKAKREKIYLKELEEIKKSGDTFSAEEFVKEQLAKAKKGGYCVSVMR